MPRGVRISDAPFPVLGFDFGRLLMDRFSWSSDLFFHPAKEEWRNR